MAEGNQMGQFEALAGRCVWLEGERVRLMAELAQAKAVRMAVSDAVTEFLMRNLSAIPALNQGTLDALRMAEDFIADELAVRCSSFDPAPTKNVYITEAEDALAAVRGALAAMVEPVESDESYEASAAILEAGK
jgi:5-deoxy-D-glucuronate isomerase